MNIITTSALTILGALLLQFTASADDCCEKTPAPSINITDEQNRKSDGIKFTFAASAEKTTVITQAAQRFSPESIKIKAGEKVEFLNSDNVSHNVYCSSKEYSFNVGAQQPGARNAVEFTKPGKFLVRCAVHLDMKLTVIVE